MKILMFLMFFLGASISEVKQQKVVNDPLPNSTSCACTSGSSLVTINFGNFSGYVCVIINKGKVYITGAHLCYDSLLAYSCGDFGTVNLVQNNGGQITKVFFPAPFAGDAQMEQILNSNTEGILDYIAGVLEAEQK
jgi:hypothetical protein